MPGSANSQYNFVVLVKNLQEHDQHLKKVFLKIRKSGLRLNVTKCKIRKKLIVFLEYIISTEGIKIDPLKTEGSTKMQRLLGIINYLAKFDPTYHSILWPPQKGSCFWITKALIRHY